MKNVMVFQMLNFYYFSIIKNGKQIDRITVSRSRVFCFSSATRQPLACNVKLVAIVNGQ